MCNIGASVFFNSEKEFENDSFDKFWYFGKAMQLFC